MKQTNQCMGCQAGWPMYERQVAMRLGPPLKYHRVEGGYPGEIVGCTADRYRDSQHPTSH